MEFVFEWDVRKARTNVRKHAVTFEEAKTVFDDAFAAIFADEDHSADEAREIIVGHSLADRLLIVCFTERPKATRKERSDYEKYLIR